MRKKLSIYLTALLGMLVLFNSCKKEYESIESIDDAAIQSYTSGKNFSKDPSGYYFKINDPGTGSAVKNSDSVFYSYSFKSLNGTVFNQTSDLSIPGTYLGYTDRFIIGNSSYLFTPIREVLSKLKRGGKATLIMPSYMAFGKNGLSTVNIGPNENILVDLAIYPQTKLHEINELEIQTFIAKNNLSLIKDPSRAYYKVITPGTGGDVISTSSTIKVNYTARYLDGTVIDYSTDGAFSELLSNLYEGWQRILPGKVTAGGKLRLVLPADLAGGTCLDFDVEIVSVTN